jgi:hypothetical protein
VTHAGTGATRHLLKGPLPGEGELRVSRWVKAAGARVRAGERDAI